MILEEEYRKYKWFFTSGGKLVVGGKNALQNDELLIKVKKEGKERYVMHTSHPGSPFCVILSDIDKVTKKDLAECAIFTGSFSRAWKDGKTKTEVHLFKTSQVSKPAGAKTGTWFVKGKVEKRDVELKLVIITQKGFLRAVPKESAVKSEILAEITPGVNDKTDMLAKFEMELEKRNVKFSREELLGALPAGGVRIISAGDIKKKTKTPKRKAGKKTSKKRK